MPPDREQRTGADPDAVTAVFGLVASAALRSCRDQGCPVREYRLGVVTGSGGLRKGARTPRSGPGSAGRRVPSLAGVADGVHGEGEYPRPEYRLGQQASGVVGHRRQETGRDE